MAGDRRTTKEESARAFSVVLAEIEQGGLHAELTGRNHTLLEDLACSAADNGKAKGSLTLKLEYEIDKRGIVHVSGDVRVVGPKKPKTPSIFWLTPGNNLSTKDPRQQELPLRVAPPPPKATEAPEDEATPARSV